jgi:2-phospho-L-lactate transferase/gluconeogenesis factor (CofD/UPF0052 family)
MAATMRQTDQTRLNVVLFSGGRGSSVLSTRLVRHPRVSLTVAVNGYDDGASTGEVRRFLGDSLGPSDFRKNASRLARELQTCPASLVDLLDLRLPSPCSHDDAMVALRPIVEAEGSAALGFATRVQSLVSSVDPSLRAGVTDRLGRFQFEVATSGRGFDFSDCAIGNLVFAGCFLARSRQFNAALDDYCALLGLSPGVVDNVTDGTNAFLVALDVDDRLLGSEADIVDAKRRNRIKDIYLIDRPLTADEHVSHRGASHESLVNFLETRSRGTVVNPRLLERIARADLIIYSPGTQHSSLFPSYLTPGLNIALAQNLTAIKVLVTNIQSDSDIAGSTAVDIIDRAAYYLREKARLNIPTPCLITHYLINDPGGASVLPYVPLGKLETIEDPRLVRIGHYEEGVSGKHDPEKILTPFLESLLTRPRLPSVAVWLHDADSLNKIAQTILELLRGGIRKTGARITVFYNHPSALDPEFVRLVPFEVHRLQPDDKGTAGACFQRAVREGEFDYALLFESSGMYQGEDIVELVSPLSAGRLDAVWGSRRLSVKDIEASYRLRYRHQPFFGGVSYIGSHLLSLSYLLLFGRYISDTLCGARVVRASYLARPRVDLGHKLANQHLLLALLGAKADVLETPVRFFAISPDRVRRTSVLDGLQSLLAIARERLSPQRAAPPAPTASAKITDERPAPASPGPRW